MSERFRVDLRGLVTLLSQHLYSGPQIYLRELIQNGVDAITARRAVNPDAPARITLEAWPGEAGLTVTDTGIGMSESQAREFLATIGRTSKRDELLGEGRQEFLGQFGVGLLAAFLVADEIDVVTRAEGHPPVRWIGRSDGSFTVEPYLEECEVGTQVRLRARHDAEHWVSEASVLGIAREYASLLPVDVSISLLVAGARRWRRLTETAPWEDASLSGGNRLRALTAYGEQALGFTPLAVIELSEPLTGTSGVAYVLPAAAAPGSGRHRVYVKGMLVDARDSRILPEWAFFVRAIVTSRGLSPTASREQLRDDEVLLGVRDALGTQITNWIVSTLNEGGPTAASFMRVHGLALRAMAVVNDDVLEVVSRVVPYETTQGPRTLQEIAEHGTIRYTDTVEAFRRVAPVARAQGSCVVNGGYAYDAQLLERLQGRSAWQVELLNAHDLVAVLDEVGEDRLREVDRAISRARALLAKEDSDVLLRAYAPEEVGAVLLNDTDAERRREFHDEQEAAGDLWGGLLDAIAPEAPEYSRTLVLNDRNPTVRRLLASDAADVFEPATTALYLSAVMLAGEPLRRHESAALSDSLGSLLDAAMRNPQGDSHE